MALAQVSASAEDGLEKAEGDDKKEAESDDEEEKGKGEDNTGKEGISINRADFGQEGCKCVGVADLEGRFSLKRGGSKKGTADYPVDVGSSCQAWDLDKYSPDCTVENPSSWCSKKWCFVDPCNCNKQMGMSALSSNLAYLGRQLAFSYETCGNAHSDERQDADEPAIKSFIRLTSNSRNDASEEALIQTSASSQETAQTDERAPKPGALEDSLSKPSGGGGDGPMDRNTGTQDTLDSNIGEEEDAQDTMQHDDDVEFVDREEVGMCDDPEPEVYGRPDCPCIAVESYIDSQHHDDHGGVIYAGNKKLAGGRCKVWQNSHFLTGCPVDSKKGDSFCRKPWCFVDPCTCRTKSVPVPDDSFKGKYQGVPVYVSFETCEEVGEDHDEEGGAVLAQTKATVEGDDKPRPDEGAKKKDGDREDDDGEAQEGEEEEGEEDQEKEVQKLQKAQLQVKSNPDSDVVEVSLTGRLSAHGEDYDSEAFCPTYKDKHLCKKKGKDACKWLPDVKMCIAQSVHPYCEARYSVAKAKAAPALLALLGALLLSHLSSSSVSP